MTAIDTSFWQGHPDFVQVRTANVDLVVMKCGGGEGGRLYRDSVYVTNRTAARAAGLEVGSYFFNGPVDPIAAADFQMSIIDYRTGDAVAIDVENTTGVTMWNPVQVLAWVLRIRAHGVPAKSIAVYMSSGVTHAADWSAVKATGVQLWVAQYGTNDGTPQGSPRIAYWDSWAMWQYSSLATCPGIVGNIDINQRSAGYPAASQPFPPQLGDTMTTVYTITSGNLSGIFLALSEDFCYVYPAEQINAAKTVAAPNFNRAIGGQPIDIGQTMNADILLHDLGFADGDLERVAVNGGGGFYRPSLPVAPATISEAQLDQLAVAVAAKIVIPAAPVPVFTEVLNAIAALPSAEATAVLAALKEKL